MANNIVFTSGSAYPLINSEVTGKTLHGNGKRIGENYSSQISMLGIMVKQLTNCVFEDIQLMPNVVGTAASVTVSGDTYFGTLAGYVSGTTLRNITLLLNGNIIHNAKYTGGLVGGAAAGSIVTGCVNYTEMSASGGSYIAGLVGRLIGSAIFGCINYKSIIGSSSSAGGICGLAESTSFIEECQTAGFNGIAVTVSNASSGKGAGGIVAEAINSVITTCLCSAPAKITGAACGGIAGKLTTASINQCNVDLRIGDEINISGGLTGAGLGGIVGRATSTSRIEFCISSANVGSKVYNDNNTVGGIAGMLEGNSYVRNCRACGKIQVGSTSTDTDCGGIVGYAASGSSISFNHFGSSDSVIDGYTTQYTGNIVGHTVIGVGTISDNTYNPSITSNSGSQAAQKGTASSAAYNAKYPTCKGTRAPCPTGYKWDEATNACVSSETCATTRTDVYNPAISSCIEPAYAPVDRADETLRLVRERYASITPAELNARRLRACAALPEPAASANAAPADSTGTNTTDIDVPRVLTDPAATDRTLSKRGRFARSTRDASGTCDPCDILSRLLESILDGQQVITHVSNSQANYIDAAMTNPGTTQNGFIGLNNSASRMYCSLGTMQDALSREVCCISDYFAKMGIGGGGGGGTGGSTLTLTFVDTDGNPASDIDVTVTPLGARANTSQTKQTDAQGRVSFNGLTPGNYSITVNDPLDRFRSRTYPMTVKADGTIMINGVQMSANASALFELPRKGCSYLPVTASFEGTSLAGLIATLTSTDDQSDSRELTTDANGKVLFKDVCPGSYTLIIVDPSGNYQNIEYNITVNINGDVIINGENKGIDPQIDAGGTPSLPVLICEEMHVIVQPSDAGAASGLTVTLRNGNTGAEVPLSTGADGSVVFEDLHSGIYVLQATDANGVYLPSESHQLVVQRNGTMTLDGNTLSGCPDDADPITLAVDPAPIPVCDQMKVYSEDDNGNPINGLTVTLTPNGSGALATATTQADGYATFTGLYAGSYTMRATDSSGIYKPSSIRTVVISEEGNVSVDGTNLGVCPIDLEDNYPLVSEVVPVAACSSIGVKVTNSSGGGTLSGMTVKLKNTTTLAEQTVNTGSNGIATFTQDLYPGSYTIQASDSNGVFTPGSDYYTLSLAQNGDASFQGGAAAQCPAALPVTMSIPSQTTECDQLVFKIVNSSSTFIPGMTAVLTPVSPEGSPISQTSKSSNGTVTYSPIPAGQYTLSVSDKTAQPTYLPANDIDVKVTTAGKVYVDSELIGQCPEIPISITLSKMPAPICTTQAVTVVSMSDIALPGMVVTFTYTANGATYTYATDSGGQVYFHCLSPGTYTITTHDPSSSPEYQDGGPFTLVVNADGTYTLNGVAGGKCTAMTLPPMLGV